ncbi:hypothetical protein LIER_17999 [Lithospermum erythrorhizon]|uniref:Uncharacterized protein n=1 Tax=Lithospermum erythrorhizon TaxID=34254 RepID=A0AAV3QEY8_LITER
MSKKLKVALNFSSCNMMTPVMQEQNVKSQTTEGSLEESSDSSQGLPSDGFMGLRYFKKLNLDMNSSMKYVLLTSDLNKKCLKNEWGLDFVRVGFLNSSTWGLLSSSSSGNSFRSKNRMALQGYEKYKVVSQNKNI